MVTHARFGSGIASLFAIMFVSVALAVGSQQPSIKAPIIVEVRRTHGQLVLTLKPNPVPGKDILWGLTALVKERGTDYPVVHLLDDNARISDIDQVPGIAAKAGFNNIRTYIVRRDLGRMVEVKFCEALPLSATPPAESTCGARQ